MVPLKTNLTLIIYVSKISWKVLLHFPADAALTQHHSAQLGELMFCTCFPFLCALSWGHVVVPLACALLGDDFTVARRSSSQLYVCMHPF